MKCVVTQFQLGARRRFDAAEEVFRVLYILVCLQSVGTIIFRYSMTDER